jgi:hypothetical protein
LDGVEVRSLTLPRSVLLALWVQLVPQGSGPLARAVHAVQGDDEPHTVTGETTGHLADLVAAWSGGPREVAALLPVPGDVAGVPAEVSHAAGAANECVLARTSAGSFAAVPEVTTFGSVYEPGHLVTWVVHRVPDWRTALLGTGSLAQAERDLRGALVAATEALAALDVARWRVGAAEAIAALRSEVAWPLPAGLDARRLRVLVAAARLRAIVELATADDGGAVNLWQSDQRSTALREIDHAARRAMCAATAHVGRD